MFGLEAASKVFGRMEAVIDRRYTRLTYHLSSPYTDISLVLDRLGSVDAIVTNRATNGVLSPLIEGGLKTGSLRFRHPCRVELVISKSDTCALLDPESSKTDIGIQFAPFA